ncbi:DUF3558 domain-containing protein [Mycobacterium sp. CBMA271]|uniref:DUF3558 domain-containing protein n=1 Tax=unclassified Mycobacteroides TaxID=2618759 RepID=UPI0012DE21C0|nr:MULTISPECIES: DUF3558 domain-containing protein [unclassified Mycobacteroides]MUM16522.1 hypothetical protein [Mycobacteroides sp. CBMA 326]MUM20531.1 DUF3558 domain-containing protein [Mycobacteroides sp. CBMA 271]
MFHLRHCSGTALIGVVAVLVIAGCGTTVDGQPTPDGMHATSTGRSSSATTTSPTVTNTLRGPHAPPNNRNDGTSFDPCLAYSAEEIKSWGVDPEYVEDQGGPDEIARGCLWRADGWSATQTVINRPVSDYLNAQRYPGAHPVEIDGLHGAVFGDIIGVGSCNVALPSQRAVVITGIIAIGPTAEKLIPDPCQKAIDIATRTAPRLPR